MRTLIHKTTIAATLGALTMGGAFAQAAAVLPPAGDVDAIFEGPWLVVPSRPLGLFVDLELALKLSKGDAEATAALKIAREKFASIPSSDPKLKAAEDNHEVAKQKKSKG